MHWEAVARRAAPAPAQPPARVGHHALDLLVLQRKTRSSPKPPVDPVADVAEFHDLDDEPLDRRRARPPNCRVERTGALRAGRAATQDASTGVSRPAEIIPGSFAAMIWPSRRRLLMASTIASANTGIIHSMTPGRSRAEHCSTVPERVRDHRLQIAGQNRPALPAALRFFQRVVPRCRSSS